MFYSLKRKYKEQIRLPLDLRIPLSHTPSRASQHFNAIESFFVSSKFRHPFLRAPHHSYTILNYRQWQNKHKYLKNVITGKLVAVIVASKTCLLSMASLSSYPTELWDQFWGPIWKVKFRVFFGHCLKKKVKPHFGHIFLSSFLLSTQFFFKFNIYSPNIISFSSLREFDFFGRRKRFYRHLTLSKRKKKVLPSYVYKIALTSYTRSLSTRKKQK